MSEAVRVKVCGLTRQVDADFASEAGVEYLGFILHPKSPRFIALEQARAIAATLPDRQRIAVSVEPTLDFLRQQLEAGFDFFQIHFRHDLPLAQIAAWSQLVTPAKLWLTPKLPPEVEIDPAHVALTKTVLFDTYQVAGYGGSGRTGDWAKFSRSKARYPDTTWVLSGGLAPENIAAALAESGAHHVDVNSGIEASPGVKDHARLASFLAQVRGAEPAVK